MRIMVWPLKMKSPQYTCCPLMVRPKPEMILRTLDSMMCKRMLLIMRKRMLLIMRMRMPSKTDLCATSPALIVWFSCGSQRYSMLAEGRTVTEGGARLGTAN